MNELRAEIAAENGEGAAGDVRGDPGGVVVEVTEQVVGGFVGGEGEACVAGGIFGEEAAVAD